MLACVLAWLLLDRTHDLGLRGPDRRPAMCGRREVQALPVGKLIVGFTALGGAFAGLAGFFEVAAVHGSANASLVVGLRLYRHLDFLFGEA